MFKKSSVVKAGLNAVLFALVSALLLAYQSLHSHGFAEGTVFKTEEDPSTMGRTHWRIVERP